MLVVDVLAGSSGQWFTSGQLVPAAAAARAVGQRYETTSWRWWWW